MSKIKRNYFFNLLYQVTIVLIPLLVTPYVSRTLGAKVLGIFDYCASISSIVVTICFLGIGNYGNRQIAYTRDDPQKVSETFVEILCAQFLLGGIATIVYSAISVLFVSQNYRIYLLLFYIWIFANIVDCTWLYLGEEDMQYTVLKNIIAKLLFVAGIFTFVRGQEDINSYIILYGITVLVANLFAYTQIKQYIKMKCKVSLNRIKKHIIESAKLFIPIALTSVFLVTDKIILGALGSDVSFVSIYTNANKIIDIPLALVTVINVVMMPRMANEFANNHKDKMREYLMKTSSVSLFFSIAIAGGIFAISQEFVPWFLGDEFQDCIIVIRVLSLVVIANTLIGIFSNQYLIPTNQIKVLTISSTASAIVNIILDLFLARNWNAVGVAIATLISQSVSITIQYIYISKQISLRNILFNSLKYSMIAVAMAMIVISIPKLSSNPMLSIAMKVAIGAVCYIGINFIIRDKTLAFLLNNVFHKTKP